MTVAATYLLRVRLPDHPGSLGQLASALGVVGADIQSIVVVDREPGFAIDDLLVGLPPDVLADRLVSAAASLPGVVVEAVRRHHGRMRVYDELALIDDAASSSTPLKVLVDGLPELLNASYVLVAGRDRQASAAAPARPDVAGWLPLAVGRRMTADELWSDPATAGPDCDLAGVPFGSDSAIVLGRQGGPEFRPGEIARLAHLASVARAAIDREITLTGTGPT